MSQENILNTAGGNEKDVDFSEVQIRQTLRNQFNPQARRKVEDLQEERALKRLLDDDYY